MKQTAIEWLENKVWELDNENFTVPNRLLEAINQANKMFEQQIIDAYKKGFLDCDDIGIMSYDEYYTETFKNKLKPKKDDTSTRR